MARRLALVVATYEYKDGGLRRLTSPAREAEELATVLRDPEVAGFDVTVLVDQPHYRVGEAIGEFYANRRRDDLTLLYFIGHGLRGEDGRLYLAMADTRRDSLPFTSLAAEQIQYAVDGSLSGQKILVLDSAYGHAHARGRFAKAGGEANALEPFQGRGCTVLTASDVVQYSFVDGKLQGDAVQLGFTRHVIAGLRDGSADLDGDGQITIDELYGYVHDRVVEERPRYRPKRQGNVEGRTIIARNVNWRPAEVTEAPEAASPVVAAVPRQPRRFRRPAVVWSAALGVIVLAAATTLFFTLRDKGADPALLGEPMRTEQGTSTLTLTRLEGKDVIVSGGRGVVLQLWDPVTHRQIEPPIQIGDPETNTNNANFATASAELDGKPVVVTLGTRPGDGSPTWVRVWDLVSRRMLGQPINADLDGPVRTMYSLVVGQLDHKAVIVTGDVGGMVVVWDLATHQQIGAPFKAHDDAVSAMTFGTLEGRPVIITGGAAADSTVRLWDLATRKPIGSALKGHTDDIGALALGQAEGRPVVVSSSQDYSVRAWDLNSFAPITPPLLGHTDVIQSVAVGSLDGTPVVIAGGRDNLVRVWDLATHKPIGHPLTGHAEPVRSVLITQVNGKPVVFTGGSDDSILAWDLAKVR